MNESVAAPQSCGVELISDPQDPANYPLAASSLPLMLHLANASLVGWDQTGSSSYTRLDRQNPKLPNPICIPTLTQIFQTKCKPRGIFKCIQSNSVIIWWLLP